MKVKNLVIVNTKIITQIQRESNFNSYVTTDPNGYRILEKRYVKLNYGLFKRKRYFVPETDIRIDKYYGQSIGEIIREGNVYPLRLISLKRQMSKEEIKVLEKKLNNKRK